MKHLRNALIVCGLVLAWGVHAQPTPAPAAGDAPCVSTPTVFTDTLASTPNDEGFFSLFDGTFKGWWQSCQTGHSSSNRTLGAIFRIDTARKAIYSTQRGGNTGGILMTNKKLDNYEIVFDYWPDFGNDGGIFHRTTAGGSCFQTVLDYINGASLGGTWGEGGYASRDYRPSSFNGNESTLTISTNTNYGWTLYTSRVNPTSFGCPTSGCTQADWRRTWSFDDWNQIRMKFYGGVTTASNVHMQSWYRKIGATPWVPVSSDTTLTLATPPNFLGLQVHGGGRFGGARGTWYKRILWRPLDATGNPLTGPAVPVLPESTVTAVKTPTGSKIHYTNIRAISNVLVGVLDYDHEIVVRDMSGKTLEKFSGRAGSFRYALNAKARGVLMVSVKTSRGVENLRVSRVFE